MRLFHIITKNTASAVAISLLVALMLVWLVGNVFASGPQLLSSLRVEAMPGFALLGQNTNSYQLEQSYRSGRTIPVSIRAEELTFHLTPSADADDHSFAFVWHTANEPFEVNETLIARLATHARFTDTTSLNFPITDFYRGKHLVLVAFTQNNDGVAHVPNMAVEVDDVMTVQLAFAAPPPEDPAAEQCTDYTGGDGSYILCAKSSLKHTTGAVFKNTFNSDAYIIIETENTDKRYVRIAPGGSATLTTRKDREKVTLTYQENRGEAGAVLQVLTEQARRPDRPTDQRSATSTEPVEAAPTPLIDTTGTATFRVSVNDYPDHSDDNKSKNLSSGYVNKYTVELRDTAFVIANVDTKPVVATVGTYAAVFTIAPGEMVYFEGFRSQSAARARARAATPADWPAPPFKNFATASRQLCQTHWTSVDSFLHDSKEYACAISLSTPYR